MEALDDVVGGISDEANRVTGAQARYASGMARMALHGSPRMVSTLSHWQREPTTVTPQGRRRLVAAIAEARRELGHDELDDEDIALLLFGDRAGSLASPT